MGKKSSNIWKTKGITFTVFKWHFYTKPFAWQTTYYLSTREIGSDGNAAHSEYPVLEFWRPWCLVLVMDPIWLSEQSLAGNWHPHSGEGWGYVHCESRYHSPLSSTWLFWQVAIFKWVSSFGCETFRSGSNDFTSGSKSVTHSVLWVEWHFSSLWKLL